MPASPSVSVFAPLAHTRRIASLKGGMSDSDGTIARRLAVHLLNNNFVDDDPTQSIPVGFQFYDPTSTPPPAPRPIVKVASANDVDATSPWSEGDLVAGRYKLLEPVAAGAWGTVWKARQQGIDRLVAVKVLKSREGPSMESARARFEREAKLASRIRHPSAVRIVEFGYEGDHPFLVMEWLEGITLGDLFRSCGALRLELVLEIGAAVSAALHCAHEEGVIHRDLKPSNIMLVETSVGMTPVVVDFGLARTFEIDEPTVTRADVVIGTPAYMCPEGIRGLALTPASDIYSLGVTLLEVLLGANPFRGESSAESMTNHLMPRVIDHEVLMAVGCTRSLAELLLSMVALDLAERPLSLRSVERGFRAALDAPAMPKSVEVPKQALKTFQSVPTNAPPAPAVGAEIPSARTFSGRRRALAFSAAALGVLAFLTIWRPTHGSNLATPATSLATAGFTAPPSTLGLNSPDSVDELTQAPVRGPSPSDPSEPTTPHHEQVNEAHEADHAASPPETRLAALPEREPEPTNVERLDSEAVAGEVVDALEAKTAALVAVSPRPVATRGSSPPTATRSERRVKLPGTLVITATPPGRMNVNGSDHGHRSSLMLRGLPVGRYTVRVERDGETTRRSVDLKSGERHVERF